MAVGALGESFAKLRDQIPRDGLANQVLLISISFDLRDSPQALEDYSGGARCGWAPLDHGAS